MNELAQMGEHVGQFGLVLKALVSLPVAALLGSILAFRPRGHGTPLRNPEVIHAQIILAVVGALIMLVIGESLARAFGIVGAAGLIRYRAKINNPKDAGVMLSTLGVGLAAGVGLYILALFATAFVLLVLWIVESHTPAAYKGYSLVIATRDPATLREKLESVLRQSDVHFELQSCSNNKLRYEVQVPLEQQTDKVGERIQSLDAAGTTETSWEEKRLSA